MPEVFDAVTATLRVAPASAATGVYEPAVAPAIEVQPAPLPSQRFHW